MSRGDDGPDPLLERGVDDGGPALHLRDHLGGQVVGGRPEAAGGDDQRRAGAAEEGQRVAQVLRAVPHDDDVADVDPQLAQPLGQPRPVAVGHPPGEHLGPGDDDAGADSHPADPRGRSPPQQRGDPQPSGHPVRPPRPRSPSPLACWTGPSRRTDFPQEAP